MYPLNIKLTGRKLLFIGGGKIAARKMQSLLKISTPYITIISPEITPPINELVDNGYVMWQKSTIDEQNIDTIIQGYDFVFACTDNRELNRLTGERCKLYNIMVNIADSGEESTFHMPATALFDGYIITVSSYGRSPAGSKKLMSKILEALQDHDT